MKAILDIVKFDAIDVITASPVTPPECSSQGTPDPLE